METALLEKKFSDIGAKLEFTKPRLSLRTGPQFSIDIREKNRKEVFQIAAEDSEVQVLNIDKKDRHLLLMVKTKGDKQAHKYLCGHDERHWFTCALPEAAGVTTVLQAKQALKPPEVIQAEVQGGIKSKELHKRHRRLKTGQKIHRQGEFMFIPQPNLKIDPKDFKSVIHRDEPLSRGRGQAHYAEQLYRIGGNTVMARFGQTMSVADYDQMPLDQKQGWQRRTINAKVYVRGRITHHQHATCDLGTMWHLVTLNTEDKSSAAQNVLFLD